ncbi:MAG: NfeD family protein [Campylobacterota bacterium]|nr:NfeD family protein [Campylobacterota bacterium]
MILFLNETVLWWHWIILGVSLIILEMTMGTFFLLALGTAAILVGLLDAMMILSFNSELLLWIVLSLLFIAIWFKWFKEKPTTDSGQSNYRLDTLGIVQEDIQPHSRGKVTFDTPVLGNSTWHATSKVNIDKGTRVQIVEINGQLIEVKPLS